MWEGPRGSCGYISAGSLSFKKWVSLIRFESSTNSVVGGIRTGMGYMILVLELYIICHEPSVQRIGSTVTQVETMICVHLISGDKFHHFGKLTRSSSS